MTTEQITEYLNKYSITSRELLAEHILQLKRNTYPNVELISELVWYLNEKFSVLNSFSAENKYKELFKNHNLANEAYKMIQDGVLKKEENKDDVITNKIEEELPYMTEDEDKTLVLPNGTYREIRILYGDVNQELKKSK